MSKTGPPKNWKNLETKLVSEGDKSEVFATFIWEHRERNEKVAVIHYPDREETYCVETARGQEKSFTTNDDARRFAAKLMRANPKGLRGYPRGARINFKLGSPVKAQKFYSLADKKFKTHDLEHPLYDIGSSEPGTNDVRHSSDVRNVQAYSSEVIWVYSDGGELEHGELETILENQNLLSANRFDRCHIYRDGRRLPALKSGTRDARASVLRELAKRLEKDGRELNMSLDNIEQVGSFKLIT